jgi:phage terminase large subunit-like protein
LTKYYYDKEEAEKAVGFIETFITHTKGQLAGTPLILEPWQKKIVKDVFGWKNKKTKLRKYRMVFISVPRKNGKSTLTAAIGLYLLFADSERGSEIFSAAADRQQAGIMHEIAKQMILNNPELSKRAKIFRNSITNESKGNFYQAISSDSNTKHGFNANGILFDELHAQKTRDLWDTLLTSTGSRRQPLTIAITTSGYDRQTICYEIYQYAKDIRDGILEDESFYPVIYEAEDKDDIQDPEVWKKANPNYGISLRKDYMERESQRAIDTPSYLNTYKRLHLNIWTDSLTAWIGQKEWSECEGKIDYDKLKGKKCWAGLDLASTRDVSALVLLFKEDEKFIVVPYFFVPKDNAKKRSEKDKVDYVTWINQGHMIGTEGDVADYNFIKHKIMELATTYNIQSICYDRWNASQLIIDIQEEGINCDGFGQGYRSMSAPTKEFEKLILGKQILHDGNPVLNWMLSNVAIMEDPAGNIKCARNKSKDKIDGIISTIMSLGSFMTEEDTDSVYDQRGLLIL